MHQKLVPDFFLILINNPKQPLHAKLCFFLWNPVPFHEQDYENKRGLELVTSPFSGYKPNSEKSLY